MLRDRLGGGVSVVIGGRESGESSSSTRGAKSPDLLTELVENYAIVDAYSGSQ